jgi:crotonobetaine/carnitine-CoA ligase
MAVPPTRVVGDLLRAQANRLPDKPYLWCGDERLTFAEVDRRTDQAAAWLTERGVTPGDRVATIASNRMEILESFFACAKLGAVLVPINVFLKGEFLRYQLDDSQASTLLVDAPGFQAARAVLEDLPELKRIVAFDDVDGAPPGVEVFPYAQARASTATLPPSELTPSSLLSIMYTSGTTGLPKGCMLPHGWYVNGSQVASEMVEYRSDDVVCTALPLFHAWAQGMVMGALVHGLTAVIEEVFSASSLVQRFAETGASVFSGVGAMGMALLGSPSSDMDHQTRLRVAMMIPFPPDQQELFEQRFGARVLAQLYGQTECGAIAYSRLSEPRNLQSLGRPAPYFDVSLFDDDEREVPLGEVGEIVVRPKVPDAIYRGYWRKPEATLEAWRNLWHHTGDFGRADEEGFITFVDRKKDALRRRGENVSSIEVEMAIAQHPKISEAAVHAIPSPMTEDDIKACVVLVAGESLTPNELFAFFDERLPYFATPRYVEVVTELPKTATLRVQKHLLRERGITDRTWDLEALGLTVRKSDRR